MKLARKQHPKNSVYIATSLDGFIADEKGGIEFLDSISIPDDEPMGFEEFMDSVDALLMGRNTFEKVLSFDIAWPYQKVVYVWTSQLLEIPNPLKDKVFLVNGPLTEILNEIHQNGHLKLYIDGGKTIQSFLQAGLIDELIITTFPCVLGRGIPLFDKLTQRSNFDLHASKICAQHLVQSHYLKKSNPH